MKFKDLKNLSVADREKKLKEAKTELVKLNGQVATGTALKSPGKIGQLKRTIAQILTLDSLSKVKEKTK
jgi:ribosomal protein L29